MHMLKTSDRFTTCTWREGRKIGFIRVALGEKKKIVFILVALGKKDKGVPCLISWYLFMGVKGLLAAVGDPPSIYWP